MAEGIAIVRALESSRPESERICYDPLAKHFTGRLLSAVAWFFTAIGYAEWRGPGVRGFIVARERYVDDCLQSCIEEGLQQVVILGAGYDTRAYRFEQLKRRVRVFEVDHPATQQIKIEKLKKILGSLPGHVVYVPIDFEKETLKERLFESGYDPSLRTLFILQGVVMYLTPEAVDHTLSFIVKNSAPGSSVVFDYVYKSVVEGSWKRGEANSMRRYEKLTGEVWHFGIEEGKVDEFLTQRGFCQIHNADSECLKNRYFTGKNQKRHVAPVYAIVRATVKPQIHAQTH